MLKVHQNMTLVEYFLLTYVKKQIYKNKPESTTEVKDEIIPVIGKVKPQLYQHIITCFNKRC